MEDREINVTDVLEVAIRLERFGISFFNKICELDVSSEIIDLFSLLASEEEKHIGLYSTMLNNVASYQTQFHYSGDYGKYLDGYAKMVFTKIISSSRYGESIKKQIGELDIRAKKFMDGLADLHKKISIEEALDIARELEISTIVFFSETVPIFKEKDQYILKLIIKEEKDHLKRFNEIRKNYVASTPSEDIVV